MYMNFGDIMQIEKKVTFISSDYSFHIKFKNIQNTLSWDTNMVNLKKRKRLINICIKFITIVSLPPGR